jgi:hypothetical protein
VNTCLNVQKRAFTPESRDSQDEVLMKIANTMMTFGAVTLLSISVVAAQSQQSQPQQSQPKQSPPQSQSKSRTESSQTGPAVKPSPDVKAKAMDPKPGPGAQKKDDASAIGKGKASHPVTDAYVYWVEEIDVDADGKPEVTDIALDNKTKTVYLANERTFSCANGASADGEVLMAVYGKGNTLGKPAGSGWFVAELDAGECGVATSGLYGCKFDANGNATQCGVAELDDQDVTITPAPRGKGPAGDSKK